MPSYSLSSLKPGFSRVVSRIRRAALYYIRGLFRNIGEHDILFYASGIAFNGLACLIPFIFLTTSALGTVLHSSSTAMKGMDEVLSNLFPAQIYSTKLRGLTTEIIRDVIVYRRSMGIVGTLTLLGTLAALFSSVRTVLHYIFGIVKKHTIIIGQIRDWGMALLVGILFLVMNGFTWLVSIGMKSGFFMVQRGTFEYLVLDTVVENIVSFIITLVTFYIIYRFIPYQAPPRRVVRVSAVTTAILWEMAGRVFAYYLVTFKPYRSVYGAYAFFAVGLVWIYVTSVIFIVGAIIGQLSYERQRKPDKVRNPNI